MMSYALEEDIPSEFKGGKLEINDEDIKFERTKDEIVLANNVTVQPFDIKSTDLKQNLEPQIKHKVTETLKLKTTESSKNCMAIATVQECASDFFTFRENIVSNAIKDSIKEYIDIETDGQFVASFLLTEINLWDSDKERLILLTERSLINIKYDFIALKKLEFKKISLLNIDNIVFGDLIYPSGSLVPRLNGIADGVSGLLQTCLFQGWSKSDKKLYDYFQLRDRNMLGIRLMWNRGKPLDFTTKWNPFKNEVPFCTLTTHPLSYHPECTIDQQKFYDLNEFTDKLRDVMGSLPGAKCLIHHNKIVLQNYIGLGSLIHNRNALGFFKVRGKFSF